jgi:hypothetical protein
LTTIALLGLDGHPAKAPEVLAFTGWGLGSQLALFAMALVALYAVAKLVDRLGWGRPKSAQWRFVGSQPAEGPHHLWLWRRRDQDEDPFEVLGIDPTTELSTISAAYIRRARATHPDLNPHDSEAKKKFQRVQRAFSQVGDEEALRRYLVDHPLNPSADSLAPDARAKIVELDLFQEELVSYRAAWRLRQATARRDLKFLQGPTSAGQRMAQRTAQWLARHFAGPPPRKILVDRVCFLSEQPDGQGPKVPYLEVFDKLLRVGTQDELHAVVTFLLTYNGLFFADRFHTGDTVSFRDIGRKLGQNAALSPSGDYADFVTNLAKLGLYEGPDVKRVK